jgi:hypothetical protein
VLEHAAERRALLDRRAPDRADARVIEVAGIFVEAFLELGEPELAGAQAPNRRSRVA